VSKKNPNPKSPIPNPKIQAILFDMDGVLIDSMPAHISAWKQVWKDLGLEVPAIELKLREGQKAGVSAREISQKYELSLSEAEFQELLNKKRMIYSAIAPTGLKPGVSKLLQNLKNRGLKLALVTGSVRENLNKVLSKEEKALFDYILTSEDIENGKPAPDPYLKAQDALKVSPSQCLVVENAPLGIASAKAAGMKVAALTSTLSEDYLKEADWIISDLAEVERIVNSQRSMVNSI
jgi:beta-phosphoglucomutase